MQTATLMSVFVLAAVVLLTVPPPADAICCYPDHRLKCDDGTKASPYCGIGECNAVGCNCDGGCRDAGHKKYNPDGTVVGGDDGKPGIFDTVEGGFYYQKED